MALVARGCSREPYKTPRRHLSTNGLTPERYRDRHNLKADYPMVASSYSEPRRSMAKTIGLGRKPGAKVEKGAAATLKATGTCKAAATKDESTAASS